MSKEIHYRLVSQREERHVIPGAQVSLHGEPDGGTSNTSFTATPSSSADQATTSQRRARSRTRKKGRSKRTADENHSARRIVGHASATSSNTATPGDAHRSLRSPGRSRQQHSRTTSSTLSTSHDQARTNRSTSRSRATPSKTQRRTEHSRRRTPSGASAPDNSSIYYTAPRGRTRHKTVRRATSTSSDQTSVHRNRSDSRGRKHTRQPKRDHHRKLSLSHSTASIYTENATRRPASRGRSRTSTARSASRSRRHRVSSTNARRTPATTTTNSSGSSNQTSAHRKRTPSRGRMPSRKTKRRQRKSRSASSVSTNSGTATHSSSGGRVSTACSASRSRLPRHVSSNRTRAGRTPTSDTSESSDQSSVHRDRSASRGRKRKRSKRRQLKRQPSPSVSTASSASTETFHRSPFKSRSRTSTARLPSSSRLHRIGSVNLTAANSRPTPMTSASAWSRATSEFSPAPSVQERNVPARQNKAVRQLFHHSSANASFQPTPFRPLAQSTPYTKAVNSGLNRPASAPPIPPRPAVATHSDPHGSSSTGQNDWHLESVSCKVDGVDVENRSQSKIIKVRSSTSLVLRSPADGGQDGRGLGRDRSRDSAASKANPASHKSGHSVVANVRVSRPQYKHRNGNPWACPRYVPPNPNDPRRSAMSRVYHRYFAGLRPAPPAVNEALTHHGFKRDADPQEGPLAGSRAVRRLSLTNIPGSAFYQQNAQDPRRRGFDAFRPASAPPLATRPQSPAKSGIWPSRPRYVPPNPNDPRRSAMSRVYNNYFAGLRPQPYGASYDLHDFNPVRDDMPPINLNVSGSFFDASPRLSGWSGATASLSNQASSMPTADSWDPNAFNARLGPRNTTRRLSFGDDVPSYNSTYHPPGRSRLLRGYMTDADPQDEPLAGSRAARRLSFTDVRSSPGKYSQQPVQVPRRGSFDPLRPASAPPLESLSKSPAAKSGIRPTRPQYVPPNPNDPRRSAMSRVYNNYFAGLGPELPATNEALTLHGFLADAQPHAQQLTGNRARSAPPPGTRPKSPANPVRSERRSVSPGPADYRRSTLSQSSTLQPLQGESSGQWNTGPRDASANGQALIGSMSRLSLGDNRCVLDGPATAHSTLKIQFDRKKNTTVLISRLVLNSVDRTKSTTKLTTRTRELPGTVVSTCEKAKQRNDGQAKTEQNIQIEKDKIVIERKTQLKDLHAGPDYSLEDTGTCRNTCQMRMVFGTSTSEGALNVASGVLISKDANGRVTVREMTRLYIGDAKERSSALVPLESIVEVKPSKDSFPLFFDESVQVGRSTIEIARDVRLDQQLIVSLTSPTTNSGLEEQRVYTPYEGPTNITPMRSSSSLNAGPRTIETERTQSSASNQSVASSIHEHPYHGLVPKRSNRASRRRNSSDAQREIVASTPGAARSDTMSGTPELSADSLSDSMSSRPLGQGSSRRSKGPQDTSPGHAANDSGTSKQSEGSKYLDMQLQAAAPSALLPSSPLIGTAVAKSCRSVSERTALSAHSASSGTHFSDKSDEQRSDPGSVVTAMSPSAQNATVRSTYAASPASSQFVSPQPAQATPSRPGNGTHLLYHTFNLPDVYLPTPESQFHEHRRVIKLQLVSNGEPLTVDLHATFRTRNPDLTLNLADVWLDSKRLWHQ